MPYLIQYDGSVLELSPGPGSVEYPPKREFNVQETPDGEPVIQRPVSDGRSRKWIWHGYRPRLIVFKNLWDTLASLEAVERIRDGLSPYVYIWENETTEGGFDQTTDGAAPDLVGHTNLKWVRVKILQADRQLRQQSGEVVYDTAELEFKVADTQYDHF